VKRSVKIDGLLTSSILPCQSDIHKRGTSIEPAFKPAQLESFPFFIYQINRKEREERKGGAKKASVFPCALTIFLT
jgi:hypothetical protein